MFVPVLKLTMLHLQESNSHESQLSGSYQTALESMNSQGRDKPPDVSPEDSILGHGNCLSSSWTIIPALEADFLSC